LDQVAAAGGAPALVEAFAGALALEGVQDGGDVRDPDLVVVGLVGLKVRVQALVQFLIVIVWHSVS
jgi:hypothetical protein